MNELFIPQEWEIIRKIGSGSSGDIYKAKKLDGYINGIKIETEFCSIKKIKLLNFKKERIEILKNLNEKYKNRYTSYHREYYGYGIDEKKEFIYIYLEYIQGAISLLEKTKNLKNNRFENINVFNQIHAKIIQGLQDLHYSNIIHRDLTAEHILLINHDLVDDATDFSDLKDLYIKFIGFGISDRNFITKTHMSPEIEYPNSYIFNDKTDVWSLGCLMIEMAGGALNKKSDGSLIVPSYLPENYHLFINSCFGNLYRMNLNSYTFPPIPLKHVGSEWKIISSLGKGAFGTVYKAMKLNGNIDGKKVSLCAIKTIEKNKFNILEVEILKRISKSRYSCEYFGYGISDLENKIYIYMECLDGAISISDLLKKQKNQRFEEKLIKELTLKIVNFIEGMQREANCVIGDIKPDHILLIGPNKDVTLEEMVCDGSIKFIDFGLSQNYEKGKANGSGTPLYMAPESKKSHGCLKSDVWSLGCTIIEMAGSDLEKKDSNGAPLIPEHLSIELKTFLKECLHVNLNNRIGMDEIKETDFILNIKKNKGNRFAKMFGEDTGGFSNYFKGTNINQFPFKEGEPMDKETFERFTNNVTYRKPETVLDLPFFNLSIYGGLNITKDIKKLKLKIFNQPNIGSLPDTIDELDLPSFNQPLKIKELPKYLSKLNIPSFNWPIVPGVLPNTLCGCLSLPSYNHSIPVGSIPTLNINELDLKSFNKPLLVGSISKNIQILKMQTFNQPLEPGMLPHWLNQLDLPNFNHPLKVNVIPKSLEYIVLPSFNSEIETGAIHNCIRLLSLRSYNRNIPLELFPNSVTALHLNSFNLDLQSGSIPSSVSFLTFGIFNKEIESDIIPQSVKTLNLGSEFDMSKNGESLFHENPFLTTLTMENHFKKPIVNVIPPSVTNLMLPNYNIEIVKNSIPKSVTSLCLGLNFTHLESLSNIPPSVFTLRFGSKEKPENIKKFIPSTVTNLQINQ